MNSCNLIEIKNGATNLQGSELRAYYYHLKDIAEKTERGKELTNFVRKLRYSNFEETRKLAIYYINIHTLIIYFETIKTAQEHIKIVDNGGWPTGYYDISSSIKTPYKLFRKYREKFSRQFDTYRRHAKRLGIKTEIEENTFIELLSNQDDQGQLLSQIISTTVSQRRSEWPEYWSLEQIIARARY